VVANFLNFWWAFSKGPGSTATGYEVEAICRPVEGMAYLFLDGVELKMRRPAGRQHVQKLAAHSSCLAFCAPQARVRHTGGVADLYRRGLKGDKL
jgi:hypothetical protein